jgi:hypothetical protein
MGGSSLEQPFVLEDFVSLFPHASSKSGCAKKENEISNDVSISQPLPAGLLLYSAKRLDALIP